jgi:hypothetical protein
VYERVVSLFAQKTSQTSQSFHCPDVSAISSLGQQPDL